MKLREITFCAVLRMGYGFTFESTSISPNIDEQNTSTTPLGEQNTNSTPLDEQETPLNGAFAGQGSVLSGSVLEKMREKVETGNTRPKANYPTRRRGKAAASSDNNSQANSEGATQEGNGIAKTNATSGTENGKNGNDKKDNGGCSGDEDGGCSGEKDNKKNSDADPSKKAKSGDGPVEIQQKGGKNPEATQGWRVIGNPNSSGDNQSKEVESKEPRAPESRPKTIRQPKVVMIWSKRQRLL